VTPQQRTNIWGVLLLAAIPAAALCLVFCPTRPEFESDHWHSIAIEQPDVFGADSSIVANAHVPEYFQPLRRVTPGAYFAEASLKRVKAPNYSKSIRNVTEATMREVAAHYGVTLEEAKDGEFDHLIPASLGGNNSPQNIWWQPGPTGKHAGKWNFKVKDRLEKRVLAMVRAGELDLQTARHKFATNWPLFYEEVFGRDDLAEASIAPEEQ